MNTNAIHNILNILGLIIGALLVYDWNAIFSPTVAASVAAWLLFGDKAIKLAINIMRDGLGGLFKYQPPVQ